MNDVDLEGWVIVVAGNDQSLADLSRAAMAAGASVGVVSSELPDSVSATVRFRTDPGNPDPWWRIAMHIEQHLGPIDGVVTDAATLATVVDVFEMDLRRRGRAPVIVMRPDDQAHAIVTALTDRPPSAPSPPAGATPDR